tara:strand:+ start:4922 stop:6199 length:1278 start_codon:yes stop_codon:yes gene_type:complete
MPNTPAQAGNIDRFDITSNTGGGSIDVSAGIVDFRYFESVLSNTVTATAQIIETGNSDLGQGTLDGLPIRGGERANWSISDNQGGTLEFPLYVNRARDGIPGTQRDVYIVDFASKEYFANTQTRVVKRYEGKISDHVNSILTDVLQTQGVAQVDETSLEYNFVGNDRKPFYVCTWLASKAVPSQGVGSAAGFLFYQTRDGYNFRSIDNIFGQGQSVGKYLYNNSETDVSGQKKILNYTIESDTELHQNLTLGTYHNKSIFFDFFAMDYREKTYSIDDQEGGVQTAGNKGDQFNFVAKEFTQTPSRFMTHILDIGVNPKGSGDDQLKNWQSEEGEGNFKVEDTQVQSIMRYNQLFTVKTQITIAGDFRIKAGDLIECSFPELSEGNPTDSNEETGGIYMVAHVCHRVTTDSCFTSLGLIRDSYGRK